MKIITRNEETFNFLETGVEGIYILDHVAFEDVFGVGNNVEWSECYGKQKLQEWAEKNLTKEILEQFNVDLPSVEEVFSKKQLRVNSWSEHISSRQWPIFKNSDNRIMDFDGKGVHWWTRSTQGRKSDMAWDVCPDGVIGCSYVDNKQGFVPVLRRKTNIYRKLRDYIEFNEQPYVTCIFGTLTSCSCCFCYKGEDGRDLELWGHWLYQGDKDFLLDYYVYEITPKYKIKDDRIFPYLCISLRE